MTKFRIAIVVIAMSTQCAGVAQDVSDSLWQTAQDAYLREDYETAIRAYESYVLNKPSSYTAMYNLGTCYLQSHNLGKSILWYERSRRVKPYDRDVLYNLSIAKARRENPVVEIREFFLMRWTRALSGRMSVMAWGILSLLCFWTAVACTIWRLRSEAWGWRRWVGGATLVGFVLAVVFGVQRHVDLTRRNVAIVIPHMSQVLIAPDEDSKLVARISEGEKVVIVDSLNTYYKVRLPNFEQGWIPAASVEKI